MERISKGLRISDSVSIFHQFLKYLSYGPTVIQKIMIILRVLRNTNCTFEGFSSEDMNILWGYEDFHSIISEIKEFVMIWGRYNDK